MTALHTELPSPEEVYELALNAGLDIQQTSLKKDETGSDFIVYHCVDATDQAWIIRIPRRKSVVEGIQAEKQLLDLVRNYISISVPDWKSNYAYKPRECELYS